MSCNNATDPKAPSREERFWIKVDKRGPDECWEWKAARDGCGYGLFFTGGHEKMRSHRFSYQLHVGPIPSGSLVLHRCDNPPCVNPAHLFLGTNQNNSDDKVAKGRQLVGERINHAKLNPDKAREIRAMSGSDSEIGALYGVAESTIWAIRTGRTWRTT